MESWSSAGSRAMDVSFTAEEQAFAAEVRDFLRAHPPASFPVDGMDAGYGSGASSKAFLRAVAEQGWISMCWPRAFGGVARPMFFKLVLMEELACAGAPFGPLAGAWQTADAIIEYGSERLRGEVLPAIRRGEATFWQGYSEPDAGSDLLALKTEARRDGEHYVIRGHKIWSSHAGIATHGLVFARTSREARRSRGFTMFVVPNDTPGMDIRPITSLTGEVYHYEVFLDDVRVPEGLRLGPEGEGFVALLNGLDSDRFWGRFYKAPALERTLRRLVEHANTTRVDGVPLARDAGVRRRLAAMAAELAALRWLFYRAACLLRDGAPITYETAVAKVLADETGQKLGRLGMDLLGLWGPLRAGSRDAKLDGEISHAYLTSLGHTIAGGTAEILRSTVATRGLGLPAASKSA
jgi:alkylation response protein AidB-like acyl-CoA dehydrogenase